MNKKFLFMAVCICVLDVVPVYGQVIAETIQLDLATVVTPFSGNETLVVDADSSVSGSIVVVQGSPRPAEFLITKGTGANSSISIDVVEGVTVSGITLDNFTAIYDGSSISLPAVGQAAPGAQGKTLIVGARATFASTVAAGTLLPGFDVIVVKE